MSLRYVLVSGPEGNPRRLPIPDDRAISIGRSPANDLVLAHDLVSAHHAKVEPTGKGPVLSDVGSRNGTRVNELPVTEPHRLLPGDRITIGNCSIVVIEEERPAPGVTLLDDAEGSPEVFASIESSPPVPTDERSRRETFRALQRAHLHLAVLNEMGGVLLQARQESDISERTLDLVFDVLPADRACVILDRGDGTFDTSTARNQAGTESGFGVSRTILDRTLGEGISLLSSDAARDQRFKGGQSVILQGIRAAMCVPLRGRASILGAIYADTQLEVGAFTQEDLELLATMGILAGVAIENLRLASENLESERLAAVGRVVAGLGHDIRNMLAAITGGAFALDKVVGNIGDPDLSRAWALVRKTTNQMRALVTDMVSFSKDRVPNRRPTDLNRVIRAVLQRFEERAEEQHTHLRFTGDPELGKANVDGSALDRVVSNLVTNALDALPESGGTVAVKTFGDPEHVRIDVTDDGAGIPVEDQERVFDLLFSTKGSKGTGFGLAVSKKIVSEHGGAIEVDSEPGRGTTFRISLPRD